ncbi:MULTISPECIES: Gfo/Idh/MocA family oxidoreductase [unclassified Pseudomonas]|uniref:Gfo/Idh/MocA family protein n=1 Tax=unclassified Pseudomonas TaxID=196821 RepID=UPI002AC9CB24|nr:MULTISPECIES: Gfo/Idh/MocA family oxidoreductase [unclassified Pseudomonas]MEB0045942.1 Gfo/Idh/MocA family oxidoreductase [Pseudomonas sp. Dout3]MEB0097202.1 Gfo/Idh/MocA family oxidoreductase [Pseudomonas sp. DC1.2]WPX56860.1 Gfo/Idh/MocA family oxidoreductase [Pseudomonas sp. DC1.2]
MRIGLVGYGHGGRFFHAPLISSLPGATFVGVVTRSAERRQLLVTEHPGVPAFDSIGQLVEAGIDVLVISTPLKGRPALVLDAIEHGVAVVSDKPFAADAQQAQTLITMAERQGVRLSVYQNRRWDSDFLTVRKLIESGALGQITRFESRVERYSPRSVNNASGGGFLRDLGSHLVDQALLLFGPVAKVYAELDYLDKDQVFDNGFFMCLTHASGVISHLGGSCLQNIPGPRFRVTGTQGCYSVDGLDGQEASALAGMSPQSEGERWGVEEHRRWGWFEHGEVRERVPSERGCWQQFYVQLQTALQSGGPLPVEPRDALATTRVLDAARLSFEHGEVMELTSFDSHGMKTE